MSGVEQHAGRAHALLSPSGSSRWLTCTPSARLEETSEIPDKTSDAAEEGTLAHEYSEAVLRRARGILTPSEFRAMVKKLKAHRLWSDEITHHVPKYTDWILERIEVLGDKVQSFEIETRCDFSMFVPEGSGLVDAETLTADTLFVDDLKFGKGVEVKAQDNTQLMLYALGSLMKPGRVKVKTIVMSIHQVRLADVSTFTMSRKDLLAWADGELKAKAELAWKGKGELTPGSWCKFCKVKPICRANADLVNKIAAAEFRNPNLLTDDEVLKYYALSDTVTDWIKGLQSHVLAEAIAGKKWEGFKVVEGRSNRYVKDEPGLVDTLLQTGVERPELYTEKLKGFGELHKLVGKSEFEKLAKPYLEKPKGAPTLAPDSDDRPEFRQDTAQDDFKNLKQN